MAKTKLSKALPDANLIRECVSYAQAAAAFNAGFLADPDGRSKTAEKLGRLYEVLTNNALEKMCKLRATSWYGLDAKRRVAQMIMHESVRRREVTIEINEAHFLDVFIADVERYLANQSVTETLATLAKAA